MIYTKGFTVLHPLLVVIKRFEDGSRLTYANTKGMGINITERKPSKLLAQPTPRLLYIAEAKRGKPAPKLDRIKSLPA